jgi:hypothetical protein
MMTLFLSELERALQQEGCPLCRIVRQHEEAWLFHTLWEFTGDPEVRKRFDESFGLCSPHARLMIRVAKGHHLGGSGVARIYETIVWRFREKLTALFPPSSRWDLRRWLKIPAPDPEPSALEELQGKPCSLCVASARTAEGAVFFLGQALQDSRWRRKYQASYGLCNPHLLQALRDEQVRRNSEVWEFLVEDHLQRLGELQHRLYELQRKQSYDVHEPVTQEEARSWQEAIWRFTGMRFETLLWHIGPSPPPPARMPLKSEEPITDSSDGSDVP